MILQGLQPAGEIKPRAADFWVKKLNKRLGGGAENGKASANIVADIGKEWTSPEGLGKDAAGRTLIDLFVAESPEETKNFWANQPEEHRGGAAENIKRAERLWYGMADVRRDLRLGKYRKAHELKPEVRKQKDKADD
jgi:hypothetical protein